MTAYQTVLNAHFLGPENVGFHAFLRNDRFRNDFAFSIFNISSIQGNKKIRIQVTNFWNNSKNATTRSNSCQNSLFSQLLKYIFDRLWDEARFLDPQGIIDIKENNLNLFRLKF